MWEKGNTKKRKREWQAISCLIKMKLHCIIFWCIYCNILLFFCFPYECGSVFWKGMLANDEQTSGSFGMNGVYFTHLEVTEAFNFEERMDFLSCLGKGETICFILGRKIISFPSFWGFWWQLVFPCHAPLSAITSTYEYSCIIPLKSYKGYS